MSGNCQYCNNLFEHGCRNCAEKDMEDVVCDGVVRSSCGHQFHFHCCLVFLKDGNDYCLCPVCKKIFEFEEYGKPFKVLKSL